MKRIQSLTTKNTLASALVLSAISFASIQANANVVIGEVYGGGGGNTAGAPWANDYVELYNNGVAPFDLGANNYTLQYFSAAATTASSVVSLTGTIPANSYFFVKGGNNSGTVGAPIPTGFEDFDASSQTTYKFNISNSAAKIGLFSGTTTAATIAAGNVNTQNFTGFSLVDFVGIGTANAYETAATTAYSRSTSVFRTNPNTDTNNNSADFSIATPTLRNSSGTVTTPPPVPAPSSLLVSLIGVPGIALMIRRRKAAK